MPDRPFGRGRPAVATRAALLAACLAAGLPGARPAAAQTLMDDCSPPEVMGRTSAAFAAEEWHRHPRYLRDTLLAPPLARQDYGAALDAIALQLGLWTGLPAGDARRVALERRLAVLRRSLPRRAGDELAELTVGDAEALRRSQVDRGAFEPIPLPSGDYQLFAGTPDQVVLTDADAVPVRRALCWTAIAVADVMRQYGQPAVLHAARVMRRLEQEWTAYDERGYSMYPWEAIFNRLVAPGCVARGWGPPRCHVTFLHPNVGYAVGARGTAAAGDGTGSGAAGVRGRTAVAWDLLGLVRYTRGDGSYAGASLIALVTSDLPPAWGATWHFERGVQGGVAVGDDARRRRRAFVFVSLDAYRLVAGLPSSLAQRRDAVGVLAGALNGPPTASPPP